MATGHEKREAQRVPLDAQVAYTQDGKNWQKTRSRDVSSTGMQLVVDQPVAAGKKMKLAFKLPNLQWQEPILAIAEVVRVINQKGQRSGLGLRFISLKANHYEVVEEFVSRVLGINVAGDFERLGTKKDGSYTYSMDKLASSAKDRKAEALEKQMMVQITQDKRERLTQLINIAGRAALLLVLGYVTFKITSFFIIMVSKLSELTQ